MTHSIKMIVTDLDDTLLRTDKTVSEYTLDVQRRCREAGIKMAIATARSHPEKVALWSDLTAEYYVTAQS